MNNFTFREINHGNYITLETIKDNNKIGRIDFTLDLMYNYPCLIMIFVEEPYRRNKIATNMLYYIQDKYGLITWNGKTKSGEFLYKSFYNCF